MSILNVLSIYVNGRKFVGKMYIEGVLMRKSRNIALTAPFPCKKKIYIYTTGLSLNLMQHIKKGGTLHVIAILSLLTFILYEHFSSFEIAPYSLKLINEIRCCFVFVVLFCFSPFACFHLFLDFFFSKSSLQTWCITNGIKVGNLFMSYGSSKW